MCFYLNWKKNSLNVILLSQHKTSPIMFSRATARPAKLIQHCGFFVNQDPQFLVSPLYYRHNLCL